MLRAMLKKFIALPLALALAACWQSSSPLIPDSEADSPPGISGTYTRSTGSDRPSTQASIAAVPNGYYNYENTKQDGSVERSRLRFDRLSDNWYLVQSQTIESNRPQSSSNYRIMKISGNVIEEYEPGCGSSEIAFEGVTVDEEGVDNTCVFTLYTGLKKAALNRLQRSLSGDTYSLQLQATYRK